MLFHRLVVSVLALGSAAAPALAKRRPSSPPPSPPPQVVFRDPLRDRGDAAFSIARKLRLEAGAYVLRVSAPESWNVTIVLLDD